MFAVSAIDISMTNATSIVGRDDESNAFILAGDTPGYDEEEEAAKLVYDEDLHYQMQVVLIKA